MQPSRSTISTSHLSPATSVTQTPLLSSTCTHTVPLAPSPTSTPSLILRALSSRAIYARRRGPHKGEGPRLSAGERVGRARGYDAGTMPPRRPVVRVYVEAGTKRVFTGAPD